MGSPREHRVVVKFNPLTDLDPYIDDVRYVCLYVCMWEVYNNYVWVCIKDWWGFPIFIHMQAHKEYRILTKLRDLPNAAPQPLFCSSDVEESIVGTAFFVMTYIEVCKHPHSLSVASFLPTITRCLRVPVCASQYRVSHCIWRISFGIIHAHVNTLNCFRYQVEIISSKRICPAVFCI